MSENANCPFCGEWFSPFENRDEAEHPHNTDCPLFGRIFRIHQWNMRPPKKEAEPVKVIHGEIEWLRKVVENFIAMKVVNVTLPNNVKVSEGKSE